MKHFLLPVSFLIGLCSYAQTVSNTATSKYAFTKIAHLDALPVQSQGNTGTCWSFSGLSFFESEMIRKGVKNTPALSEMYIVRKAYEAKAVSYVRADGKKNFSEGGAFHDIPYVINAYGIVPQSVYNSKNESDKYDHGEMFAVLNGTMSGIIDNMKSATNGISPVWKKAISGVLDAYLGVAPTDFMYEGKKYTPQSYAAATGLKMEDYVSITSFTNHPMNSTCILEIPDNWASGMSYNTQMEDLFTIAENALKNGYTIAWGADVSEKGFSFRNGLGIVPEDMSTITQMGKDARNFSEAGAERKSNAFEEPVKELAITQDLRQQGYDNKTTQDDHGMHIVGLYQEKNGTKYLLVKNSWGTDNFPKGYLYVSQNYFNYKTINIYLHKDGVPKDIRTKLKIN
jgi:bleomycin hydrolase